MRSVSTIIQGLTNAYAYFEPTIVFIFSLMSDFLDFIENRWYLMFTWLLLNAGFCFWVVGRSFFDWSDIITDGLVRGALLSRARANRIEEQNERYQARQNARRDEYEETFQRHREIIQADFYDRQTAFMNNYNAIKSGSSSVEVSGSTNRQANIDIVNDDE